MDFSDFTSYGDYINSRLLGLAASGVVIRFDGRILPTSLFVSGFYLYFRLVCFIIGTLFFIEKLYIEDMKGGD